MPSTARQAVDYETNSLGGNSAINLDASDPDFARSLRQLGAVQPNPTMSPSSTFPHPGNQNRGGDGAAAQFGAGNPYPVGPDPRKNPALTVLAARSRIQDEADAEFLEAGKKSFVGRRYVDVGIIRQILLMRERGVAPREIEKQLDLKSGVVEKLGAQGVVAIVET